MAAEPHIDSALFKFVSSGKDVVVVDCPVARAEYKGNPAYPYRTHPQLLISSVPSLLLWGRTKPVAKLQDDQLMSEESILR